MDRTIRCDMNLIQKPSQNEQSFLHGDLSSKIIGTSFEVMRELGMGFLESVYHKSAPLLRISDVD